MEKLTEEEALFLTNFEAGLLENLDPEIEMAAVNWIIASGYLDTLPPSA